MKAKLRSMRTAGKVFLKRLLNRKGSDESGSVTVIVALCMTALFGISALAVDFGMLASAKGALQNAADAAALAAAKDLGVGAGALTIENRVEEYCRANGCDPDDAEYSVTYSTAGRTITVNVTREMSMGFSAVLTGERTRTVSAKAVANVTSIFGGCPFAMMAGRRIEEDGTGIVISGNNIQINGNIHSNSDISMSHAVLGDGVIATAVRNTNPSTTGWNNNAIALDLPSFQNFENALQAVEPVVEFYGNITKKNKNGFQELINEALQKYRERMGSSDDYRYKGLYIHIAGSLTFNGNNSTTYVSEFPIILIVDGDIDLNGAPITSTVDFPVSVMTKRGNLTVNGGGASFTGILFAPKGDIILNGNNAEFTGSIVAQNIRKTGGKITVSYNEDVDRFLPASKVHLIE